MKLKNFIKLLLLLSFIGVSLIYVYKTIADVRGTYQRIKLENLAPGAENVAHKHGAEQLVKQSEQFQGWAVLILGGIVAISVTTKVHRLKHFGWVYLPLGPAGSLLVGSLAAGWVFSKRYTYILQKNNFDLNSLSDLVGIQSDFFSYSVLAVSIFALIFLIAIVFEKTEPFEEKKNS